MPLYTADALVLRTYKLGEADRIVVFLTRDRGKKRGVAPNARRPRKRFGARARAADRSAGGVFREGAARAGRAQLRRAVRSPLSAPSPEALGYSHYFAELIDEWAAEADADERLFRLGRRRSKRWCRARRSRRWRGTSSAGCCGSRASTRRTCRCRPTPRRFSTACGGSAPRDVESLGADAAGAAGARAGAPDADHDRISKRNSDRCA